MGQRTTKSTFVLQEKHAQRPKRDQWVDTHEWIPKRGNIPYIKMRVAEVQKESSRITRLIRRTVTETVLVP